MTERNAKIARLSGPAMSETERDASGWYPTEYERRLGLDPDPGRPTSEGSNRHKPKGFTMVSTDREVPCVPADPTLADLRAIEAERDALQDEVNRLRKANLQISNENAQWQLRCDKRARALFLEMRRRDENQRAHWARCYKP